MQHLQGRGRVARGWCGWVVAALQQEAGQAQYRHSSQRPPTWPMLRVLVAVRPALAATMSSVVRPAASAMAYSESPITTVWFRHRGWPASVSPHSSVQGGRRRRCGR